MWLELPPIAVQYCTGQMIQMIQTESRVNDTALPFIILPIIPVKKKKNNYTRLNLYLDQLPDIGFYYCIALRKAYNS